MAAGGTQPCSVTRARPSRRTHVHSDSNRNCSVLHTLLLPPRGTTVLTHGKFQNHKLRCVEGHVDAQHRWEVMLL